MAKAAQESLVPIAQSIYEAEMNLAKAESERSEAAGVLKEKQDAYNAALAQYTEEMSSGSSATAATEDALNACRQEMEAAQSVVDDYDSTI